MKNSLQSMCCTRDWGRRSTKKLPKPCKPADRPPLASNCLPDQVRVSVCLLPARQHTHRAGICPLGETEWVGNQPGRHRTGCHISWAAQLGARVGAGATAAGAVEVVAGF